MRLLLFTEQTREKNLWRRRMHSNRKKMENAARLMTKRSSQFAFRMFGMIVEFNVARVRRNKSSTFHFVEISRARLAFFSPDAFLWVRIYWCSDVWKSAKVADNLWLTQPNWDAMRIEMQRTIMFFFAADAFDNWILISVVSYSENDAWWKHISHRNANQIIIFSSATLDLTSIAKSKINSLIPHFVSICLRFASLSTKLEFSFRTDKWEAFGIH